MRGVLTSSVGALTFFFTVPRLEAAVNGQRIGYARVSTVDQNELRQFEGQVLDGVSTDKHRQGHRAAAADRTAAVRLRGIPKVVLAHDYGISRGNGLSVPPPSGVEVSRSPPPAFPANLKVSMVVHGPGNYVRACDVGTRSVLLADLPGACVGATRFCKGEVRLGRVS